MVTPVAYIRPRVCGVFRLPVEACLGDAVGVISVCRSGIEELRNDMIGIERIGIREGFPVLEDVAPVTLVVEDGFSRYRVSGIDIELVPRTCRVTMTTTEP